MTWMFWVNLLIMACSLNILKFTVTLKTNDKYNSWISLQFLSSVLTETASELNLNIHIWRSTVLCLEGLSFNCLSERK